jgi:hypothetical protein
MDDYSGMLFDNRHSQFLKDSSAVSLYGGLNGGFVPIHTIDNTGAPWPQQ